MRVIFIPRITVNMTKHRADQLLNALWTGLNGLANCTILYKNGHFILVTFGLLVTGGAVISMFITAACFLAHGFSLNQISVFLIGATVSAIIFAHFFWWIEHLPSMIRQPFWGVRYVGYVSWGGLFGVVLFCLAFSVVCGYPFFSLSDGVLRGLFAAYAVGRIGCLTYGCCYGLIADKHGIQYKNPDSKVVREKGSVTGARYPTQIYSCMEGIILFLLLNAASYYAIPAGLITALSLLFYPVGRAYIETYRDRKRYLSSRFTGGQLACVVVFLLGCMILFIVLDDPNVTLPPKPLSLDQLGKSLSLVPAIAVAGFMVFLATGFHWKQVGTW